MARLRTTPGTSTNDQRCRLHQLKRRLGMTDDQLHDAIGAESTTALSAAAASEHITRLGGGELPNPPGKKPSVYKGRAKPGVVRMITEDHVDHIMRLGGEHFHDGRAFLAWLSNNFKVAFVEPVHRDDITARIRELGTAKRAADVISTLKGMHARRRKKQEATQP